MPIGVPLKPQGTTMMSRALTEAMARPEAQDIYSKGLTAVMGSEPGSKYGPSPGLGVMLPVGPMASTLAKWLGRKIPNTMHRLESSPVKYWLDTPESLPNASGWIKSSEPGKSYKIDVAKSSSKNPLLGMPHTGVHEIQHAVGVDRLIEAASKAGLSVQELQKMMHLNDPFLQPGGLHYIPLSDRERGPKLIKNMLDFVPTIENFYKLERALGLHNPGSVGEALTEARARIVMNKTKSPDWINEGSFPNTYQKMQKPEIQQDLNMLRSGRPLYLPWHDVRETMDYLRPFFPYPKP